MDTKIRKRAVVYKADLLYPELCYRIIGIVFDIFYKVGYGFTEKQYGKAIEIALKETGLDYKKELPVRINYKNTFLTTNYLDFLIDNKIILELKQGNLFLKKDIDQIYKYLKITNLKLGLLIKFTRSGVKFKRIVNIN
ncbi:MAG: hypothetical protein Athens071426_19 [Parcubacteria group bacterium Athens0714_26]|nr:MAG: hypothetical protein Athens101426_223 [Parcubacteria group bacterium Athens1014_26]TSD03812.1 MAG: hypothetical protein Athens071426_19 [Parcubacteria group bacterium Athens0714_26]